MAFGSSSRFKVGGKGSFKAPPAGYQKESMSEPGGGGSKGSAPDKVTYTGIHVGGATKGGRGATTGRKSLSASLPSFTDHGNK